MQSPTLHVSIRSQTLTVRGLPAGGKKWRRFRVSTSRYGPGTEPGSYKTPLGRFEIAHKIGGRAPLGSIFKSRVQTGEIGDPSNPEDLIQTRILWLRGLDPGNANTMERYIYIHGTNHEEDIGKAASHGCVRMRNRDIMELYRMVRVGTPVFIQP